MSKEENTIPVMESVYAKNETMADKINCELTEKKVFAVNVMGAPGIGKTTSLIQIIKGLSDTAFVIEGDIQSDLDTRKLNDLGIKTVQINTGGACHLDVPFIEEAVGKLPCENGFLFIENIGNLVCPAEFVIGEHIKLLICSVTEGSDKPYKYPLAFEKADVILLNKIDLLDYVDFDREFFEAGIRKLNPEVPVFCVSGKTGEGYDEVIAWLTKKAETVIK